MMPLIQEPQYHCIMKQTIVPQVKKYSQCAKCNAHEMACVNVFQVLASRLWEGLGSMQPVFHLKCVTLLHQLHNLAPVPRTIERILARSLGYGQQISRCGGGSGRRTGGVDSYQRFTLLWHLSRDLEMKGGSRRLTFDICLLKMLDNLNLSSGPLKALSQSWLVHAMARGDMARLMEPLFLTLLDPSTARVSVLHATIEHLDTVDASEGNKHRIYAISSSNKEVVYHVSSDRQNDRKETSDQAKRIFAFSKFQQSKNSNGESSPATPLWKKNGLDAGGGGGLTSVNLMVNPFALVPPEVEEYGFFTKGYCSEMTTTATASYTSSSIDTITSQDSSSNGGEDSTAATGLSISKLFGREDDDDDDHVLDSSQRREIVSQILTDIVDDSVSLDIDTANGGGGGGGGKPPGSLDSSQARNLSVHPLHSHLLLYCQVCDSRQILYTMQCIKNIVQTNPRLSICTLSSTNLSSAAHSARSNQIQILLARHRKSVFAKSFAGSLQADSLATYRNSTLIEVLISTLLYYLRSYYPNLGQFRLSDEEIQSNREVQLMSIDILSVLVAELVMIVQDNGRAYATYIADLFSRCKVQKVVLHSLLACINDMRDTPKKREEEETLAFTEDILRFNEIGPNGSTEQISNYSEAFQVQVLRLLLSLVMLEQAVNQQRGGENAAEKLKLEISGGGGAGTPEESSTSDDHKSGVLRYHNDHVIPDQPMFLAAIVSALRQEKMRHLHSHWTCLITSCLPFLGKSLSQTVLEVTAQLSRNLEMLAPFYSSSSSEKNRDRPSFGMIPADYVVTQLEALTMIYHYCLLDPSSQVSPSFIQQLQQPPSNASSTGNNGEILNNLLHVFLSNADTKSLAAKSLGGITSADTLVIARKILISTLPRLVATAAVLWKSLGDNDDDEDDCGGACSVLVGSPRAVRSRLLDLLSPIAHHHPVQFLSAVGITWKERRPQSGGGGSASPMPSCHEDQQVLVDLVGLIRTLPVTTVIQTVRQVIKSSKLNVEVNVLQFFYAYLARCSALQVFESWASMAALLRDCLALAPPAAIFLALSILNQFVHRSPSALSDRKDQKELQDLAGRLIESCAQIGGACLEQTTWLRRNFEVNPQLQHACNQDRDDDVAAASSSSSSEGRSASDSAEKKAMTVYSVPALVLLGDLLAPLLDIVYNSEEKEKVVPLLYTVMGYVIPYLRNHSKGNGASFRACSKLLAALSEYQYTRKAWKKEGTELLLDPAFFQMDLESLQQWEITVDNLMTHDKTTFKELMGTDFHSLVMPVLRPESCIILAKVSSISQSGSLSLFTSKEQELEQRTLLLKRLAFVIFCSEVDQYQKQMPDIQGMF